MITANNAYDKSFSALTKRIESSLQTIEKHILNAAEKGEFEVNLEGVFLDKEVMSTLESLGYVVERHDDQREGAWTIISWKIKHGSIIRG